MGKRLNAWKNQLLSWNPVLNIAGRVFWFSVGATFLAASILFIWRAGSTALAEGVWKIPAVPELWIVVTGFALLPTAVHLVLKSVLPQGVSILGR